MAINPETIHGTMVSTRFEMQINGHTYVDSNGSGIDRTQRTLEAKSSSILHK